MIINISREHFEPDVVAWPRPDANTLRYASDRRAELFSLLNSLALVRRHGPTPFERRLRAMTFENVRALNRLAPVVLP